MYLFKRAKYSFWLDVCKMRHEHISIVCACVCVCNCVCMCVCSNSIENNIIGPLSNYARVETLQICKNCVLHTLNETQCQCRYEKQCIILVRKSLEMPIANVSVADNISFQLLGSIHSENNREYCYMVLDVNHKPLVVLVYIASSSTAYQWLDKFNRILLISLLAFNRNIYLRWKINRALTISQLFSNGQRIQFGSWCAAIFIQTVWATNSRPTIMIRIARF